MMCGRLLRKCITFFLLFSFFIGNSQTTLAPGDIVIIGLSGDNKSFRFVPLVNLAANTQILFTDSGWITATSSFRPNEGAVRYTAPAGGVVAGTNIEYAGLGGEWTDAGDPNVGTNDLLLNTSGDQVFAFQGTTAAPNFIFAVQSNSLNWQAAATNSNNSALPTGLVDGLTAVSFGSGTGDGDEFDNIWYNGVNTNDCPADILASVGNESNWTGNNTSYAPVSFSFTLPSSCSGGGGGMPTTELISTIQGSGPSATNVGSLVTVEAVVIGDYQAADEMRGFFIQEEDADHDADTLTSEGIYVFCDACPVNVAEGDLVEVTGVVTEFANLTEISVVAAGGNVTIVSSNKLGLVTPATLSLPAATSTSASTTYESVESMLVEFTNTLTVTEHFQLARYGQLVLSAGGKQIQYTQTNQPSAAGYTAHQTNINLNRIILDDYNDDQNIDPVLHPVPGGFSNTNIVRGGSTVTSLKGIMDWSWAGFSGTDAWRIRPVKHDPVSFIDSNPRVSPGPAVGGDVKVVSFNVLNYFNGNGSGGGFPTSRGAHSQAELDRQTDKIVSALTSIDADIIALVELENDYSDGANSAIASLVTALNASPGSTVYDYVNPGSNIGTDEIVNGFIYKSNVIGLSGPLSILDTPGFLDPNGTGSSRNRPAIAQTFEVILSSNPSFGEKITVAANHLKSKGSSCGAGDDDTTTGQGNCNGTRALAATELVNWLATDPTASGDTDFMIVGDLNAYAMEDPIDNIVNMGYTDLATMFNPMSTSFVFSGEWGTLDYALVNADLLAQVTDMTVWNINADEVSLLDYNDTVQDNGEQAFEAKPPTNPLYASDEWRSSDHDPIVVGLSLGNSLCPSTLNIPGAVPSGLYEAGISIVSDGQVIGSTSVDYSSGSIICLDPGFEVDTSGEFHAFIQGCN
jgi:predicted extracellular nuclease